MGKRLNKKSTKSDNLPVSRPMPLPKTTFSKVTTGPGVLTKIKKTVLGSEYGSFDAYQKKMAVLVVILFCVLGGVLFITMGGSMTPRTANAHSENKDHESHTRSAEDILRSWHEPGLLTQDLRNVTEPVLKQGPLIVAQPVELVKVQEEPNKCVVNGIVFSKSKPSAIINHQIIYEGQSINGIKVLKILRNTVKLQANGKQWVQSVQFDIQ
jgi:hypothetical protein